MLLCATSVFSVSLWLQEFELQQTQSHREHSGCTEDYDLPIAKM
jgi:hypothetical protein